MGSGTTVVTDVEQTLLVFYSPATPEENRRQAHSRLVELQDSPAAWDVAIQLLDRSAQLTAQLFGVNCLHAKLMKSWSDVSLEQAYALQQFLWRHVYSVPAHPVLVKDRLSSALAVLVLQTVPDVWETPLQAIIREGTGSDAALCLTLQVLAAVPYNFRKLPMALERKGVVRSELSKSVHAVQSFLSLALTKCLGGQGQSSNPGVSENGMNNGVGGTAGSSTSGNLPLTESVINCLENWLEFESDISDWESLISFCLSPRLLEVDDDLLGPVSRLFQNIAGNSVLSQFDRLSRHVYEFIAGLLVQRLNEAQGTENLELCATLAKMLSTLVENHAKFLLKLPDTDLFRTILTGLLKLTLPPAQYPLDEQYSPLTLRAWTAIWDDLTTCNAFMARVPADLANQDARPFGQPGVGMQQGSATGTVHDECTRLKGLLRPYYHQLLTVALQYKLRLPENFATNWPLADQENWWMYRREFMDVLLVVHRLCPDDYFNTLMPYLNLNPGQQQQQHNLSGDSSQNPAAWRDLEVGYYALEAVADNCHDPTHLRPVFDALGHAASHDALVTLTVNPDVANAALRVVSKYAGVIIDNAWYAQVLALLIKCLDDPKTVTEATLGLKDLAESKDARFFDSVTAVLQPQPPTYLFDKLYSCVNNRALSQGDRTRALTCIGAIISYLPEAEINGVLTHLVLPKIEKLHQIADGKSNVYPSKEALLEELDFIATLVGSLDPRRKTDSNTSTIDDCQTQPSRRGVTSNAATRNKPHPVHEIVSKCLGAFAKLHAISNYNAEIAEKICEILQKSIRTLDCVVNYNSDLDLCCSYAALLTRLYVGDEDRVAPAVCVLPVFLNVLVVFGTSVVAPQSSISHLHNNGLGGGDAGQLPNTGGLASIISNKQGMVGNFDAVSAKTLAQSGAGNIDPDLAENYLTLVQNALRKVPGFFTAAPSPIWPTPNLVPVLQMIISGLNASETAVLKQAAFAMTELLKVSSDPSSPLQANYQQNPTNPNPNHNDSTMFAGNTAPGHPSGGNLDPQAAATGSRGQQNPVHAFMTAFLASHTGELTLQVFNRLKSEQLVSHVEYLADVLFHMVKHHNPVCLPVMLSVLPQHHLVQSMAREGVNKRKTREFAKKVNAAVRKGQIQL